MGPWRSRRCWPSAPGCSGAPAQVAGFALRPRSRPARARCGGAPWRRCTARTGRRGCASRAPPRLSLIHI
eukprot:145896-Pyramimonas_sp.AAC.1